MRAYERPTLTAVGRFSRATGFLKRHGPPDIFGRHRLFG